MYYTLVLIPTSVLLSILLLSILISIEISYKNNGVDMGVLYDVVCPAYRLPTTFDNRSQ